MNALLLSFVLTAAVASAEADLRQEALEAARAHYAAAAYEEALSTLARLDTPAPDVRVELEQYRALCLIALGRLTDAERAVAAITEADPAYVPPADIASPRVLSLVAEMRARHLPAAARRLLEVGRELYQQKRFDRARDRFTVLLGILDDPDMPAVQEHEDLRLIAQGFLTLAAAEATVAPPVQAAVHREEPEEAAGAGMRAPPVILPPVPIQQEIPSWVPPDIVSASRPFQGSIRVRIGVDGRVKSARIEEPTHPAFDTRLLRAAQEWLYTPATRDGVPMEYERVISVQLRPRQ